MNLIWIRSRAYKLLILMKRGKMVWNGIIPYHAMIKGLMTKVFIKAEKKNSNSSPKLIEKYCNTWQFIT